VLDNLATGRRENLADALDHVEVIEGDVRHLATVGRAMEDVDRVFHEAAIPSVARSVAAPLASHEANATGTLNVLIAARGAELSRDFTFVGDVVQANILASEAPQAAWGRAFNVAYDERHSVNELLAEIRSLVPGVEQPEPELAPPRAGEIRDSQADVSAAREV